MLTDCSLNCTSPFEKTHSTQADDATDVLLFYVTVN